MNQRCEKFLANPRKNPDTGGSLHFGANPYLKLVKECGEPAIDKEKIANIKSRQLVIPKIITSPRKPVIPQVTPKIITSHRKPVIPQVTTPSNKTELTGVYEIDYNIILNLDPKSILNLCQSGKQISPACNDQNLFAELIKMHYPNANITQNPKEQFISLVNTGGMNLTGILDVDREIFLNLDPKSIYNLCSISRQTHPLCNDQNLFRQLIKKYYPTANPSQNPKKQFLSLVKGITTKYYTTVNRYDGNYVKDTNGNIIYAGHIFSDNVYLDDPKNIKDEFDDEIIYFTINGIGFDDDIYWLQISMQYDKDYAKVFMTKEDAVNDFLNDHYDDIMSDIIDEYIDDSHLDQKYKDDYYEAVDFNKHISSMVKYGHTNFNEFPEHGDAYYENIEHLNKIISEIFNSKEFQLYLEQKRFPKNLYREGLFEYIMKNSFFNFEPYKEDISNVVMYQFVKVTIRNRYEENY